MKRALLVLGSLVLIGVLAFWLVREGASPETIEIPSEPMLVPSLDPAPTEAPPANEEEDAAPEKPSPSREKFESDDDTEDTDDGLTIEVEREE
jgi:hypothetical protein